MHVFTMMTSFSLNSLQDTFHQEIPGGRGYGKIVDSKERFSPLSKKKIKYLRLQTYQKLQQSCLHYYGPVEAPPPCIILTVICISEHNEELDVSRTREFETTTAGSFAENGGSYVLLHVENLDTCK